jgi:regulator of sigma E protease
MILAFMNILPIPALDGGYILFIIIEIITRRKPGDKFIGYANTVGFIILMLLLLYANGMDLVRLFG